MAKEWANGHFLADEIGRKNAALALVETGNVTKAARQAKVSPTSLRAWLDEPEFRKMLTELSRAKFKQAIAMLAANTNKAVEALKRNMDCGNPQVEVRAASAFFDIMMDPRLTEGELEEARQFVNTMQAVVAALPDDMKKIFKQKLNELEQAQQAPIWVYGEEVDATTEEPDDD